MYILHENNIETILSAVRAPSNFGQKYQQQLDILYPKLSEQYKVPLYPFLIEEIFGNSKYMKPDAIHPNAAGTEFIAEKLSLYFLDYLS